MRWLGIKQRSGLWHRKTGRFGRKIRALPPVKIVEPHEGMFCFTACCIQLKFDFYWEHILARRIFFSVIFFRLLQQEKPLTTGKVLEISTFVIPLAYVYRADA